MKKLVKEGRGDSQIGNVIRSQLIDQIHVQIGADEKGIALVDEFLATFEQ